MLIARTTKSRLNTTHNESIITVHSSSALIISPRWLKNNISEWKVSFKNLSDSARILIKCHGNTFAVLQNCFKKGLTNFENY